MGGMTMPTEREIAEALESAILHWEQNREADGWTIFPSFGADNCPLCKLFVQAKCQGCPVVAHTEGVYCRQTPYGDAVLAWASMHDKWKEAAIAFPEYRRQCQAMVDLLKSFRK
jgi:hypothetical protein